MAARSRFTRIPKVHDLVLAGVPTEVIPTYCALADHTNNKTDYRSYNNHYRPHSALCYQIRRNS